MKSFKESQGAQTSTSAHVAPLVCSKSNENPIRDRNRTGLSDWLSFVGRKLTTLWSGDLGLKRSGFQLATLCILAFAAIAYGTWQQDVIRNFEVMKSGHIVRIFYMVPDLDLRPIPASTGLLLIWIAIARSLFNIAAAWLDMIFHHKITGRPFDWESMINVSLVNGLFSAAVIFASLNQPLQSLLSHYDQFIANIPTLIDLNGIVALIAAAMIGDFCFYWSHRVCHGRRMFWNLGHIHHHRNRNLTQMTCAIEPSWIPLQAAGGLSLLMLPVLSKLFTTDIQQAGWALVAFMLIDVLTDPSHSIFMYWIESKSRVLRALRSVFVTVGVHYTHHSNEFTGKDGTGCNFGSRLTIWDRLFGTYLEPTKRLPRTGLFDPEADLCVNPLRYVLLPYVRMGKELARNHARLWPRIVFGSTEYEPPNPVHMSR